MHCRSVAPMPQLRPSPTAHYQEKWEDLYAQDRDWSDVWEGKHDGGVQTGGDRYVVLERLVWKVGDKRRRLCVPRQADADKRAILERAHARYPADGAWLDVFVCLGIGALV